MIFQYLLSKSTKPGRRTANHGIKTLDHGSKPAKVAKLAKFCSQYCQSLVSYGVSASQHSSCLIY